MDKRRCAWVSNDRRMIDYHDREWGVPLHQDRKLFEFLVLEGMQAGLSWSTILNKRASFRKAFSQFNPVAVACFTARDTRRLLGDPGIIRNRLKIEAAINNAQRFLEVQKEFGSFDRFIWQFVGGKPVKNERRSVSEIPSRSALSDAISQDLKKRGFKFVGTTIVYAHMQATGMVNDHTVDCFRYGEL
jgi:DNA-3-methyladenine glycosylase I